MEWGDMEWDGIRRDGMGWDGMKHDKTISKVTQHKIREEVRGQR
jgi:hypothetical protein